MNSDAQIDRAATAGYESFRSGALMPAWVAGDELLASAWHCGRRQAADRAQSCNH